MSDKRKIEDEESSLELVEYYLKCQKISYISNINLFDTRDIIINQDINSKELKDLAKLGFEFRENGLVGNFESIK